MHAAFMNGGAGVFPQTMGQRDKLNSANRDLGNLRKLYRTYWTYEGQEEHQNHFRELRFSDTDSDPAPPLSDELVKSNILAPGALDGLHQEAQLRVKVLIETC